MADVFISYSSNDRDFAESLATALANSGISTWWDRELAAGTDFEEIIERELRSSKLVLVLWSEEAASSRWVKDESSFAIQMNKYCPVKISKVNLPLGFRSHHVVDISKDDGDLPSRAAIVVADALGQLEKLHTQWIAAAIKDSYQMVFMFVLIFLIFGPALGYIAWEKQIAPLILNTWGDSMQSWLRILLFMLWMIVTVVLSLAIPLSISWKLKMFDNSPENFQPNPNYKPPK